MAMDNVITYLRKVDPGRVAWADSLFLAFRPYERNQSNYANAPFTTKQQCRENLQKVQTFLTDRRAVYEPLSSQKEYARALQSIRVALQAEDVFSGNFAGRDLYMAENTAWLLEQAGPDAKIVLWAHNYHVSVNTNGPSMGWHLRNRYGDDMIIFGFDFYQGSFNAVTYFSQTRQYGRLEPHVVISTPPQDSYEYNFRGADIPRMFINLRNLQRASTASDWLFGPRRFRSIGAVYDDANPNNYFYSARLPEEFDVMIYFQETSPSVLLPF